MPRSTRATGPPDPVLAAAIPKTIWAQRATSFIWYRRPWHSPAMSSRRVAQNARNAGKNASSNRGWAAPGSGKYPASGTGRSRRTRNAIAALPSSAGSRSAGSAASRPRRSSSAAIASNNAAVSRHDRGAPGGDQPRATSSAWPRTSPAPGTPAPKGPASRAQPPKARAVPHSSHRDHLATLSRHRRADRGEPARHGRALARMSRSARLNGKQPMLGAIFLGAHCPARRHCV